MKSKIKPFLTLANLKRFVVLFFCGPCSLLANQEVLTEAPLKELTGYYRNIAEKDENLINAEVGENGDYFAVTYKTGVDAGQQERTAFYLPPKRFLYSIANKGPGFAQRLGNAISNLKKEKEIYLILPIKDQTADNLDACLAVVKLKVGKTNKENLKVDIKKNALKVGIKKDENLEAKIDMIEITCPKNLSGVKNKILNQITNELKSKGKQLAPQFSEELANNPKVKELIERVQNEIYLKRLKKFVSNKNIKKVSNGEVITLVSNGNKIHKVLKIGLPKVEKGDPKEENNVIELNNKDSEKKCLELAKDYFHNTDEKIINIENLNYFALQSFIGRYLRYVIENKKNTFQDFKELLKENSIIWGEYYYRIQTEGDENPDFFYPKFVAPKLSNFQNTEKISKEKKNKVLNFETEIGNLLKTKENRLGGIAIPMVLLKGNKEVPAILTFKPSHLDKSGQDATCPNADKKDEVKDIICPLSKEELSKGIKHLKLPTLVKEKIQDRMECEVSFVVPKDSLDRIKKAHKKIVDQKLDKEIQNICTSVGEGTIVVNCQVLNYTKYKKNELGIDENGGNEEEMVYGKKRKNQNRYLVNIRFKKQDDDKFTYQISNIQTSGGDDDETKEMLEILNKAPRNKFRACFKAKTKDGSVILEPNALEGEDTLNLMLGMGIQGIEGLKNVLAAKGDDDDEGGAKVKGKGNTFYSIYNFTEIVNKGQNADDAIGKKVLDERNPELQAYGCEASALLKRTDLEIRIVKVLKDSKLNPFWNSQGTMNGKESLLKDRKIEELLTQLKKDIYALRKIFNGTPNYQLELELLRRMDLGLKRMPLPKFWQFTYYKNYYKLLTYVEQAKLGKRVYSLDLWHQANKSKIGKKTKGDLFGDEKIKKKGQIDKTIDQTFQLLVNTKYKAKKKGEFPTWTLGCIVMLLFQYPLRVTLRYFKQRKDYDYEPENDEEEDEDEYTQEGEGEEDEYEDEYTQEGEGEEEEYEDEYTQEGEGEKAGEEDEYTQEGEEEDEETAQEIYSQEENDKDQI